MSHVVSSANSLFRVTLWPTTPLAPRPVLREEVWLRQDGMLGGHANREPRVLPDEWVLRQLGDAQLDDDAAVVALLNEYGPLSPYLAWTEDEDLGIRPGSIEQARRYLGIVRALADTWARASRGEDPTATWADFAWWLNRGLLPYRARVEIDDTGASAVDLYSAAALQVFNLMVEGQTARRCENVKCGRIFVHQLGRAKFRQHWNNPRYCTEACAHAEASRQYRRRKAAKNNKEDKP
jgi:hypothetical protein